MITYEDVKKNEDIGAYIRKQDEYLSTRAERLIL